MELHTISYTTYRHWHPSTIPESVIQRAAALFSNHYAVWGNAPGGTRMEGARVKLSPKRMRAEHLFNDKCLLVVATSSSNEIIGHAFCTTAPYPTVDGGSVLWVSQLVVHIDYRGQGIARGLLANAKVGLPNIVAMGVVSSHPYTIRAVASIANNREIDLAFIANHGASIVEACNLPYLKPDMLRGSLFGKGTGENISLADTGFFIDHSVVHAALEGLKDWSLGRLPAGHEFLLVARTICRSRSWTNCKSRIS